MSNEVGWVNFEFEKLFSIKRGICYLVILKILNLINVTATNVCFTLQTVILKFLSNNFVLKLKNRKLYWYIDFMQFQN